MNLCRAQGNLPAALDAFNASLRLRVRLAKADPGNAGCQRDLSVSHAKLANLYRQAGEPDKALGALREGQAIIARMVKLSPDNAMWRKDLAWFDSQIAALEAK